jgi:hypothetical protein
MSIEDRSSKAGARAQPSGDSGYTRDPGPYEALVIAHVQNSRMGQLQVYIPDWGGLQTDPENQITVKYASPFYGKTAGTDSQQIPPTPLSTGQSYGMWMVPPDIGAKVLVTFVGGDRDRGYWFACCYDSPSHHMVPGIGRNIGGKGNTVSTGDADLDAGVGPDSVVPVVEFTTGAATAFTETGLVDTKRYQHAIQTKLLVMQGLDRDKIRGAISSSSMREVPSNVYGISTPGKKVSKSPAGAEDLVLARFGGHQFVMDDGAAADSSEPEGTDQLIRLRTAGGHQILMNDTEQIFYIASANGYQYLEFGNDGMIHMFGYAGINVRAAGALNLHSDSAVNINSGGSVNINGALGVKIESLATVDVKAAVGVSIGADGFLKMTGAAAAQLTSLGPMTVGSPSTLSLWGKGTLNLNCGTPPAPVPPIPTIPKFVPDVIFDGKRWVWTPGAIASICSIVPAHEPWIDPATGKRPAPAKGGGLTGALIGAGFSVASKLI